MSIIKAKVQNSFAIIPNKTAQDTTLTFEARGLLTLMLSLPDDWVIHKSWIQEQSPKCGRDKLNKLINELTEAGYMRKQPKYNHEENRLDGYDWFVYPMPEKAGVLKTSTPEKQHACKSAPTKETDLQSTHEDKVLSETSSDAAVTILEYFNLVTKSKLKPTTKAHIQNINARLADGYTPKDLIAVIDHKQAEWKDDPKYAQYIRPSTLFQTGKFDGYLKVARLAEHQPQASKPKGNKKLSPSERFRQEQQAKGRVTHF